MSIKKCFYSITISYITTTLTVVFVLFWLTVFRDPFSESKLILTKTALPNLITGEQKSVDESRIIPSTGRRYTTVTISKLSQKYKYKKKDTGQMNKKHQILIKRKPNSATFDLFMPLLIKNNETATTYKTTDQMQSEKRIYRIVLYSETRNSLIRLSSGVDMQNCYHYKNCKIVQQDPIENDSIKGDAIVVQAGRIPKHIPKHRDENQVFVFASLESPDYIGFINSKDKRYCNYFNWTMTYKVDSSIPYLYGSVVPKSFRIEDMKTKIINSFLDTRINNAYMDNIYKRPVGDLDKNYSFIFNQKEKQALWFVSHCFTASKREIYITEMKKHMNIDTNKACNKDGTLVCPKEDNNTCDVLLSKKYKFYLSFENSICSDYITEKFFKWFKRDIVTVVRGARHYNRYLPKGTYIDTNDFATPKELALYLNRLGSNAAAYTAILKRKDSYSVVGIMKHVQLSYCHLCYKLNNLDHHRDVVPDMNEWWGKSCVNGQDIKDLY